MLPGPAYPHYGNGHQLLYGCTFQRIRHRNHGRHAREANEIYVKLFEIYRSYSDVIDSVTTWGVADDYSWLSRPDRPNYPLLFNADHSEACVYIDD